MRAGPVRSVLYVRGTFACLLFSASVELRVTLGNCAIFFPSQVFLFLLLILLLDTRG